MLNSNNKEELNKEKEIKNNNKINMRTIKGITLIALVITIIVLLILAGVSIAMLTGQNGILNQSNKAKEETETAKIKENEELIKQEIYIDVNTNPIKLGETATDRNRGYKDKEGKIAVIPKGFKVSDKQDEQEVKSGLVVIAPDESEFVWIPVETVVSDTEANGTINKAIAIQDGINYKGLLYDFTSSGSTVKSGCTTTIYGYREPDVLLDYDNNIEYLEILNTILGTNLANSADFKTHLLTEYKNMIESVKKYNGFYVGRYETSLNGNTVQSKKNQLSATSEASNANMWYGLYAKQKTYNTESVQGQMIWGSQYDAMMNWMQKNNIDVSSSTPIIGALNNTTRLTGSVETDKLNNIYDILGNSHECVSESLNATFRVDRRRLLW